MIMRSIAAAAVLALAACSAAPAAPPASPAAAAGGFGTSAAIADPVPILRLTGCPVPASEKYGTIGVDADRVAYCTFPGGEMVFVFTYASVSYRDNRLAHPLAPPSDGSYTIRGPGASVVIVDAAPDGTYSVPPQQVAARVHGTVESP